MLDTDHASEIERGSPIGVRLAERLENANDDVAICIVTVDEQLRGLLNLVKRAKHADALIRSYKRLQNYLEDLTEWQILDWDERAEENFAHAAELRLRVSTMDLRIACIALANNSTLLSRNLRDFQRVPGLRVEDWLS